MPFIGTFVDLDHAVMGRQNKGFAVLPLVTAVGWSTATALYLHHACLVSVAVADVIRKALVLYCTARVHRREEGVLRAAIAEAQQAQHAQQAPSTPKRGKKAMSAEPSADSGSGSGNGAGLSAVFAHADVVGFFLFLSVLILMLALALHVSEPKLLMHTIEHVCNRPVASSGHQSRIDLRV